MKQLDAGEVNFSILRIVLKVDFVARLAEAHVVFQAEVSPAKTEAQVQGALLSLYANQAAEIQIDFPGTPHVDVQTTVGIDGRRESQINISGVDIQVS